MGIKEKRRLRLEGRRAHVEGKPSSACPYAPSASEGDNWLHGWWQRAYEQAAPEAFKTPRYVPPELI